MKSTVPIYNKIMIDRIFKNIKTTMVGITSFLTGAIMVYLDKASLSEFGGFIGVAFAFFFAKDPKQKTNDWRF